MLDTLLATVLADRNICCPICAFVRPAATPSRISRSRAVSCGNGSAGACGPRVKEIVIKLASLGLPAMALDQLQSGHAAAKHSALWLGTHESIRTSSGLQQLP